MAADAAPPIVAEAAFAGPEGECEAANESPITVMIQHISCRCTAKEVEQILINHGFAGTFQSIYVPSRVTSKHGKSRSNFGYSFVEFKETRFVEACFAFIDGKIATHGITGRPFKVSLAHKQQNVPSRRSKLGVNYAVEAVFRSTQASSGADEDCGSEGGSSRDTGVPEGPPSQQLSCGEEEYPDATDDASHLAPEEQRPLMVSTTTTVLATNFSPEMHVVDLVFLLDEVGFKRMYGSVSLHGSCLSGSPFLSRYALIGFKKPCDADRFCRLQRSRLRCRVGSLATMYAEVLLAQDVGAPPGVMQF